MPDLFVMFVVSLRIVPVFHPLSSQVGEVGTETGGSLPEALAGRHLDLALVVVRPAGTAELTAPTLHLLYLHHLHHLHLLQHLLHIHLQHWHGRLDWRKGRDDACEAVDEVS